MNPIQPAAGQSQAPAAPQGAAPVCIAPQADGSFSVYKEGDEQGAQQAADIDAALDAARTMLGGAAPEATGTENADALFEQGFDQARGQPLNRA